jgi:hypothetical protein
MGRAIHFPHAESKTSSFVIRASEWGPVALPSTVRVSMTNSPNPETQANDISPYPAISGDGYYVVFLSAATNRHDMVFLVLIAMVDGISFRFPML